LAICHIESEGSQLSLFRSVLSFRCCGLGFGPFGTPNGRQTGHQNHQRNDMNESIRSRPFGVQKPSQMGTKAADFTARWSDSSYLRTVCWKPIKSQILLTKSSHP
jgi:hypothetical protein